MSTIRNFDALNDIDNLRVSGEAIAGCGLHHQIVVTLMDLPPGCEGDEHSAEYYVSKIKEILDSGIPFQSICFKDASGTANQKKVYETLKQTRKIVPQDTILWFHTHDTASSAISQNLAAIEGGADGIDLSKSPCSGGTCQADIFCMWHNLKGTGYSLDIDITKVQKATKVFEDCMKDYFLPPEATKISYMIPFSPMPGGALTANTMMMRDTNTLHLYDKVIAEMADVVRKGGYGTSVTPVSQFYFQQAYANVVQGKWKKITDGYGNMVLGYFGKTPSKPDPQVVKIAAEQLGKEPFVGDPIAALPAGIPQATKILQENGLEVNDENIFIIASCEDKGLQFLKGKSTIGVRKITDEEQKVASPQPAKPSSSGPSQYQVKVDGKTYSVEVAEKGTVIQAAEPSPKTSESSGEDFEVISAFAPGNVLKVLASEGQEVAEGELLVVLEAMKMETPIKAPKKGKVAKIFVAPGDTVQTGDNLIAIS
jgi:pyruvate carboxylase subunit B